MRMFDIPKSIVEMAESNDGFLLPGDPPSDVNGWVTWVSFYRAEPLEVSRRFEFLFVEETASRHFMASLMELMTQKFEDGWKVGESGVSTVQNLFHCALCCRKRRVAGPFKVGASGLSICSKCAHEMSAEFRREENG